MSRASWSGPAAMTVWLTTMWVLLWGSLSPANVVGGLAASALLLTVFPLGPGRDHHLTVRPLAALSFLWWFVRALVASSLAVTRDAVVPASRSRIRPAIVAVPLRTRSGRLATTVANTITLTPGTMTVETRGRPATLFVHVMSFTDVQAVLDDVADIERRVVRAFGSAEDLAALAGPVAEDPSTAAPDTAPDPGVDPGPDPQEAQP